jgi:pyruvate/2-oxoglutarate dehydrogenase complex dihydrolipoamide dehydrogenase (E3) component
MCKKYDVDIRLNSETTVGAIAAEKPDIVVVATSAKPAYPPFKGLDQNETMDAWDVLAGKVEVGHKAIIIGGGLVGCETADYLAAQAHIVTIVEMMPDLVSELALGQQWAVSDLLDSVKEKCEIKTGSKVIEILKDGIVIEKEGKLETLANYNSVILACGSKPFNPFDGKLTQFPQVHVIGDASKVRKIIDATDEGTKLALEI